MAVGMRGLIKAFIKWLTKKPAVKPPPPPPPVKKPPDKPGCKTNCDKPNPYTKRSRAENQKSKKSYEDLIAEHKQKLEDYKRDPLGHDNKGTYRNAPTPEIREKVYNGRIQELERQIAKQQGELAKIIEALGE
jgi:hypothetical protein